MELSKEDLSGQSSGLDKDPQKIVDQNLDPDPSDVGGSSSNLQDIIRMVRDTVREFNGLTNELKQNPEVASMIAQNGQDNNQNISGGDSMDHEKAYNLFKSGIEALEDQLGEDTTLKESHNFLVGNEELVKEQIKGMM